MSGREPTLIRPLVLVGDPAGDGDDTGACGPDGCALPEPGTGPAAARALTQQPETPGNGR